MSVPFVPGVVVERALPGRAAYRGRVGREQVDVVVLTMPPDPVLRRAALGALTPLVGPAIGPIPRCRSAVLCRDGVALIADAVEGQPVASLPTLLPGHAVALGRPVAQAMAVVHARGLTWGGGLGELLVDGAGAPRLPYDALAARRVEGTMTTARSDVAALCRLLARHCVDPRLSALASSPPPNATVLSRQLRRVARAHRPVPPPPRSTPLGAPAPAAAPEPAAPLIQPRRGSKPVSCQALRRRRRPSRRVAGAAAAAVALAGTAGVGWWSARPPREAGPALAAIAATDWTATLHGLDLARAAALAGAAPLSTADAPGSPAMTGDTATRVALLRRALSVLPPVPVLRAVVVRSATSGFAVLSVTDTFPACVYRDAAGRVVGTAPARGPHTWVVVLTSTAAGWRLAQVT